MSDFLDRLVTRARTPVGRARPVGRAVGLEEEVNVVAAPAPVPTGSPITPRAATPPIPAPGVAVAEVAAAAPGEPPVAPPAPRGKAAEDLLPSPRRTPCRPRSRRRPPLSGPSRARPRPGVRRGQGQTRG